MSVELVLMMPLVLVFLFVLADIGRLAEARGQVQAAASDAARAASVQRSAADGDAAANAAVVSDLGGLCPGKDHPAVPSDANTFTPNSRVTYTVTCPVSVIPPLRHLSREDHDPRRPRRRWRHIAGRAHDRA